MPEAASTARPMRMIRLIMSNRTFPMRSLDRLIFYHLILISQENVSSDRIRDVRSDADILIARS